MRILIVEDEKKTAAYLCKGLIESNFSVDVAHNGEEGAHLAKQHEYDLIILDVMLPKKNGWEVIKEIREHSPNVRILFLTARDAVEDRVKGLELGADDYLIKPFAFTELLARIRTLLRRKETSIQQELTIADLRVDIVKHKIYRGDVRINLTAKEFNLLVFMLERTGEVLSRTQISSAVWDINFDSDTNAIDVAIRRLRQKIDDSFDIKLIHTIRGLGYVLEQR